MHESHQGRALAHFKLYPPPYFGAFSSLQTPNTIHSITNPSISQSSSIPYLQLLCFCHHVIVRPTIVGIFCTKYCTIGAPSLVRAHGSYFELTLSRLEVMTHFPYIYLFFVICGYWQKPSSLKRYHCERPRLKE